MADRDAPALEKIPALEARTEALERDVRSVAQTVEKLAQTVDAGFGKLYERQDQQHAENQRAIGSVKDAVAGAQRTDWGTLGIWAGLILTLVTCGGGLVVLYVTGRQDYLTAKQETVTAVAAERWQFTRDFMGESSSDRKTLLDRMTKAEKDYDLLAKESAWRKDSLEGELELMRFQLAVIYEKAYGTPMPQILQLQHGPGHSVSTIDGARP